MRTIRKRMMILFIIACAFAFPSVMYAADNEAAGRYEAVGCSQNGVNYQCEGEYILLNEGGSGEIRFGDYVYSLKWELDGTSLSFTDEDGESASGTLENGEIDVEYLDYQFIYVRNDSSLGGSIDDEPENAPAEDAAAQDDREKETWSEEDLQQAVANAQTDAQAGAQEGPDVYLVTGREVTGNSGPEEGDPIWRYDYIALNEDGSGVFLFNYSAYGIRWIENGGKFSFTDHLGNQFDGTIGSGKITGVYGKYRYIFELSGTTLPAYTLLPGNWGQDLPAVVDEAGVLSGEEEELKKKAAELAEMYDVGVYVVLVGSMDDYTRTRNISTLGEELRAGYSIGIGSTEKKEKREKNPNQDWKDSILLTIAVQDRKYDICASGDYANWAFTTYAREKIRDQFLDDLKANNWAGSVEEYLDGVASVLKVSAKGKQFSFKTDSAGRMIGFFAPLLLALIFGYGIAAVMRSSMQNTQKAENAASYVASDKVNFTRREDRYIRTLVTRTYSPKEKGGSGGGGGSFSSSSGSSHTSGSF